MTSLSRVITILALSLSVALAKETPLPPALASGWEPVGRVKVTPAGTAVTISGGSIRTKQSWKDCEATFRARAAAGSPVVQIWGAIRAKDDLQRYAFGLRGGAEPQLSLARYAPDGKVRFLGWVPLEFEPKVGEWYTLRVAAAGDRFHVYLNDEKLPRLNVADPEAGWTEGGVAIGGGWLPTEFSLPTVQALDGEKLAAFKEVGTKTWAPPTVDKASVRKKQRADYKPVTISALPPVRGEFSLDGNWLFMPGQDLPSGTEPAAPATDDENWHIMPVPALWTPTIAWLHGEGGLPGLPGIQNSRGPSDLLRAEEQARVDSLTFDWNKTNSAWYRQYLDLPSNISGRRFELVFDGIAKVSEIWVNGQQAASNVGMFRQVRADITKFLKPGRNVIAVHDVGTPENNVKDAKTVADVAVTVEVTNEMLQSLPHGMSDWKSGGIWQPVKLIVTNPVFVSDVFIKPRLDGATAEIEIGNDGGQPGTVNLTYAIRSKADGSILFQSPQPQTVNVPANGTARLELQTPKLQPKLWSPAEPNLYTFDITLKSGERVLDQDSTRFGFRTFTVDGDLIKLNGQPFWMRGGNHFPVTLKPNDDALAKRFTQLAKEGNLNITRSHALPFTAAWFDATDEVGMGVSFEGTWPWLMLKGDLPSPDLLKVWKDEFASLIKQYRNRPSLLMWTVNNEMKFPFAEPDDALREQKWRVLDDMIRTMRETDPTRPIVADSGYTRVEARNRSGAMREANKFDDGDIDDQHRYYGWYNESPMYLFNGQFGDRKTPGRPLISQELSTGYPRNDDWPSRSYQFQRYVPQALVGMYALEQNDPAIFMKSQALMTKEVAEAIRRTNRETANGAMHFAYLTWFTDVWKAGKVRPKETYFAIKTALQPVLVSAELFGRHFYTGEKATRRVSIANDSEKYQDLSAGTLTWEIRAGNSVLARGTQATPAVKYYANAWIDVPFLMPARLPQPRVDATLNLRLDVAGKPVSTNQYDIVIAAPEWAQPKLAARFQLFDPSGAARETLDGIQVDKVTSPDQFKPGTPLIIGDAQALAKSPDGPAKLQAFLTNGGRALLLNPGDALVKLFPDAIRSYRKVKGEIVTMEIPESPVFEGIEPLDMWWFERGNREIPYACTGTYEVDRNAATPLAHQVDLHPDIKEGEFFRKAGAPIVEIKTGKGLAIATEMLLSSKSADPIAGKLLTNLLTQISSPR